MTNLALRQHAAAASTSTSTSSCVFVADDQGLRFELLPVPTNAEVLAILDRLLRRIERRLAMHTNDDGVDEDARPDVLAQVQADAATTWRSSTEARATVRGVERLRARCEGFSLHAGVVVAAHDRATLKRLAPPVFVQERLAWTADGRIAYKLRHRESPLELPRRDVYQVRTRRVRHELRMSLASQN